VWRKPYIKPFNALPAGWALDFLKVIEIGKKNQCAHAVFMTKKLTNLTTNALRVLVKKRTV